MARIHRRKGELRFSVLPQVRVSPCQYRTGLENVKKRGGEGIKQYRGYLVGSTDLHGLTALRAGSFSTSAEVLWHVI